MRSLRETLESLELCCWNATEDELEEKVQEWLKNYPHLRDPATIDVLRQAIKTWHRIQRLEELLKQLDDPKEEAKLISRIDRLTRTWMTMLGNLAVTYTRVQYKSDAKRVQPPLERLAMLTKKEKKKK